METKHFPGPWQLCYDGQIDSADGRTVARFDWGSYREFTELSGDEQKTLRLISAAPELLAAAQAAEAILARQKWIDASTDPEAVALRQLRAAIAKATGGAE